MLMDEKQQDQTPITNQPEGSGTGGLTATPEAPNTSPEPQNNGGMQMPRKSRRKKVLIIILVLLLLAIGAAAAWYFLIRKTPTDSSPQTNTSTQEPEEKPLQPSKIAFFKSVDSESQLSMVPLEGGDQADVPNSTGSTVYDIEKNHIAVAVENTEGEQKNISILYSGDSGKSFTTVFEDQRAVTNSGFGLQITSVKLSSDGSKIAFGTLDRPAGGSNKVRSVTTADKEVTDLFTVDSAGVFIEGYNTADQMVYYFAGCYNCDGNRQNNLLQRKIGESQSTELYDRTNTLGVSLEFNEDFSRAVVATGSSGRAIGAVAPYSVQEFTLADKSFKDVATDIKGVVSEAGYTNGEDSIYYSEGNSVYKYLNDKKITVFEGDGQIYKAAYVGLDYAIVGTRATNGDVSVVTFNIKEDKASTVLAPGVSSGLAGVVWE